MGIDEDDISRDTRFTNDLNADSLDTVELIMDISRTSLRSLLACVGRYVFPAIRPLLETDLQGLIMTPFDAREFRKKLDQMELGV